MKLWLGRRNDKRRRTKRDEQFTASIQRYCEQVLAPLDLAAPSDWNNMAHKKNARVYLGEEKVWKFFRPNKRRYARNFSAATAVLSEAGVPHADLFHSDTSDATKDKYRLCCLVMRRIMGRELERRPNSESVAQLAQFLARLHSIRSDTWGECHALRKDGYVDWYFDERLEKELALIPAWLSNQGEGQLPDMPRWFRERREATRPMEDGFCFVSGDAHPHNFMRRPDGSLCLIDMDRSRFLDFPLDVVYSIFSLYRAPLEAGHDNPNDLIDELETCAADLLVPYFEALPEAYRSHWLKERHAWYLRILLRDMWSLVKSLEEKYTHFEPQDVEAVDNQVRIWLKNIRLLSK